MWMGDRGNVGRPAEKRGEKDGSDWTSSVVGGVWFGVETGIRSPALAC